MKKRKIGYIDIDDHIVKLISKEFSDVSFCDIRKTKHKIYDIVIHDDSLTIEEKTMYELFNSCLINTTNSTFNNLIENIKNGLKRYRYLSNDQMRYINVINKFQYINEKIERLVGDNYSHSLKVAYLLKEFCDKTHMSEERTLELFMAGLMHDIGKMYVNPKILCKKGKLTKEEYDQVKIHPIKSYEMLKGYLPERILLMIREHHQREDNSGYPENEYASSEWAKILSLTDSYDAMISKRVYNTPLSKKDGINELLLCSKDEMEGGKGIRFNPYLTELFVKTINT